jgi:hypothetical protein
LGGKSVVLPAILGDECPTQVLRVVSFRISIFAIVIRVLWAARIARAAVVWIDVCSTWVVGISKISKPSVIAKVAVARFAKIVTNAWSKISKQIRY